MPPPKQNKDDLSWSHILPQNHEPRLSLPSNRHLVEVEIEGDFVCHQPGSYKNSIVINGDQITCTWICLRYLETAKFPDCFSTELIFLNWEDSQSIDERVR